MRTRNWMISAVCTCGIASGAVAGVINESGDAGDMPGTAQYAYGSGILDLITGTVNGYADADMYAIFISDPTNFSATTNVPGTVAYDTQLFLFDANGLGVAANDDVSNGNGPYNPRSVMPVGSLLNLKSSGLYYIAVSGWDRDPHSTGGAIFTDDSQYTGTVGPNGPGGVSVISGWDGDSALNGGVGAYQVALTGASFVQPAGPVPEPSTFAALLVLGILPLASRHVRGGGTKPHGR